jgi:glycosyltransferase involved in cell wall biosynthesis
VFKNLNKSELSKPLDILIFSKVSDPKLLSKGFYRGDYVSLLLLGRCRLSFRLIDRKIFSSQVVVCYFYSWSTFIVLLRFCMPNRLTILTGGVDQVSRVVQRNYFTLAVKRALFLLNLCLADQILVPSKSDFDLLEAIYGSRLVRDVKISQHPVVRPEKYKNIFQRRAPILSVEDYRFNFLTISSGGELNHWRKGVDRSAYFVSQLNLAGYCAKLHLIGVSFDDFISCKLGVYANKLLGKSLIVHGRVSDARKMELLGTSSAYLQFSRFEGFGLSAVEALLGGVPVIHSNAGGLKDSVGGMGYIYSFGVEIDDLEPVMRYIVNYKLSDSKYNSILAHFDVAIRADAFARAIYG